jgi:sec-independent protein translocase protein TatB
MFGIGSTELIVILLVALIVLGPKSLAGIARTMGKAMGEFRRVSTDFQRTLNAEAAQEDEAARKKRDATAAGNSAPSRTEQARTEHSAPAAEAASGTMPSDMPETKTGQITPPPGSPLAEAVDKAGSEAAATQAVTDKPAQGQA